MKSTQLVLYFIVGNLLMISCKDQQSPVKEITEPTSDTISTAELDTSKILAEEDTTKELSTDTTAITAIEKEKAKAIQVAQPKPKKKPAPKKKPRKPKKKATENTGIAKINPEDFAKQQASPSGKPELAFKRNFYNFEKIVQGTQLDHDFIVYNLGTAPLIIKEVKSPCDCTTITYPKDPIPPDEQAAIRFQYNSTTKMGKQNPILTVITNADPAINKLYVEGEVMPKDNDSIKDESVKAPTAIDTLKSEE